MKKLDYLANELSTREAWKASFWTIIMSASVIYLITQQRYELLATLFFIYGLCRLIQIQNGLAIKLMAPQKLADVFANKAICRKLNITIDDLKEICDAEIEAAVFPDTKATLLQYRERYLK